MCSWCSAATAAPAAGRATIAIVTPLSLVNTGDLAFGSIVPGTTSGTVIINAFTEARTTTGGATAYGGSISAGKFQGLTSNTSHLKIDVPNGSITIKCDANGATMLVNNFQLNGNKNDWVTSGTVFTIQVGATLNVAANQAPSYYHGDYNVTVNYR